MTEYKLVKMDGYWKTLEEFETADDAVAAYKAMLNDDDFDGSLIGVSVEPYRKMAYMLERSDWE